MEIEWTAQFCNYMKSSDTLLGGLSMGNPQEARKTTWRSMRPTVAIALSMFVLDAFVLGILCLTLLASVMLVVWLIPRTLVTMIRGGNLPAIGLRTAIYLCAVMATFAAYKGNNYLAQSRAETVIAAVYQFKADYHQYPDSLKELVPKYLKSVPRAKYAVMFGEFIFRSRGPSASLMYYEWPPFLRRIYHFDSRRWMVLD